MTVSSLPQEQKKGKESPVTHRQVFALMVTLILLHGCETTKHATEVQPSGFLAEYRALLQPGKEETWDPLRVYRNPKTDFAAIKKIQLDPVTIWNQPHSTLSPEQKEDLQRLADYFYNLLYVKLGKDYEMVLKPTPGAVRVQVAITHGEESVTALALVSKVAPTAQLANALWAFATDRPSTLFVGDVTVEFMAHDSQTGELLTAGADRRVGGRNLFDKEVFNSWGDVQNSLEFWSDATVYRMCLIRRGANCVKPNA
nr:DUF3313 domain-containing protein [Nitrospirota bacterium]